MNETALKLKVMKAIKAKYPGSVVHKLNDNFTSGILDLLIVIHPKYCYMRLDAMVIFLELKSKGNNPTPLQSWEIQTLKANLAHADWADTFEGAMAIIDKLVSPTERRN
jgi:hypothetical protein